MSTWRWGARAIGKSVFYDRLQAVLMAGGFDGFVETACQPRGIIKALPKALRDWAEAVERALSQVRAWVEHPFHIVKNLFRHKKLRYRGLAKNTAQLHTLFALANLVIVKRTLLAQGRA